MDHKILALGGDGIGPEVLDFGLHLIYKIQDIFGINIKILLGLFLIKPMIST